MAGHFTLHSAGDVLAKLERDAVRMDVAPFNPDPAFDFFVTAEHLPEWLTPPDPAVRRIEPLLRVVSHVANGLKHFEVHDKRHRSVTGTGVRGGYFPASYFGARYFASGFFGAGRELYVALEPAEAAALGCGERVGARELAQRVLTFWRARL